MTIEDRCRRLLAARPDLRAPERHFELWLGYDVTHHRLPRDLADLVFERQQELGLANHESVRRASRKVIHERPAAG